jgi:hypothetical protein
MLSFSRLCHDKNRRKEVRKLRMRLFPGTTAHCKRLKLDGLKPSSLSTTKWYWREDLNLEAFGSLECTFWDTTARVPPKRARCPLAPQPGWRCYKRCQRFNITPRLRLLYIDRVVTINLSFCSDAILMCRQRSLALARPPDSRWKLSLKLRLNDCINSLVRIALGNLWPFASAERMSKLKLSST